MNQRISIADKLGIIKDEPQQRIDVNHIIKDMNKNEAIEVIEDFIYMMKQTYPNIAFGAWGFCTSERDNDPDATYSSSDDKRYAGWPSCNECFYDISDGYGLLDKSLKVIKEVNNND